MDYFIVAFTVLIGAGLTLFSGFGLGTLMLPVFSIFFPLPVAIGATAIVHLSNNLFKFGLVYKHLNFQKIYLKIRWRFSMISMSQIHVITTHVHREKHFNINFSILKNYL